MLLKGIKIHIKKIHADIISFMKCDITLFTALLLLYLFATVLI